MFLVMIGQILLIYIITAYLLFSELTKNLLKLASNTFKLYIFGDRGDIRQQLCIIWFHHYTKNQQKSKRWEGEGLQNYVQD